MNKVKFYLMVLLAVVSASLLSHALVRPANALPQNGRVTYGTVFSYTSEGVDTHDANTHVSGEEIPAHHEETPAQH
ncbi:MAG: hypothetical protein ORN98_10790 [Alphaproteobacteria bacterium]|nr:hypothetical protein [Alphaproteobacteria bacterium]